MRADNEKHTCYPSVSSIANDCKMSDRKARTSIHNLEKKEIIKIRHQYVSTRNGFNRQASNYYTVELFENNLPPAHQTASPCTINSNVLHDIQPPPAQYAWEINKTKPIITKSNITKPTEPSLREAEEVEKERNTFLKLKGEWFERMKKDFSFEDDGVILIDRALEHLWNKKSLEYDGIEYAQRDVQKMLIERTTPRLLASCFEDLLQAKTAVRSPVAYLGKCILGALVRGEMQPTGTTNESDSNACSNGESSFDIDDFFEAALKHSYEIMG
jgi:hypothetical protein